MDNKPDSEAAQPADAPNPAPVAGPVMDVVAPPPPAPPPADPAPPNSDSPAPDDNKPHDPPPDDHPGDNGHPVEDSHKTKLDPSLVAKPVRAAGPKQPGSGVALAIVGTVIIVLALAGLAVYAYLKTR
jgi:hypothetical protein